MFRFGLRLNAVLVRFRCVRVQFMSVANEIIEHKYNKEVRTGANEHFRKLSRCINKKKNRKETYIKFQLNLKSEMPFECEFGECWCISRDKRDRKTI